MTVGIKEALDRSCVLYLMDKLCLIYLLTRVSVCAGIKEALDRSEYHTIYSLVKYLRQIDSAKSQALPDPIKM